MATAIVYEIDGTESGKMELPENLFGGEVNKNVIHEAVVTYLANQRQGTASTKERSDVRGGGRKPYRQKGTGRARAGNSRSPLWRGGMTVFGPTPRDYSLKMSKKARKNALKSILTDRVKNQMLTVVDKVALENPKTKEAVQLLNDLGSPAKTLFLLAEKNPNLELGVRNLPNVNVLLVDGLNVYDLLAAEKIVCTPQALKKIEERLA